MCTCNVAIYPAQTNYMFGNKFLKINEFCSPGKYSVSATEVCIQNPSSIISTIN